MELTQQKYSFRQFLIPIDHQEVKNYRAKSQIINNKILQAIGDSSQPPIAFSLNQTIIDSYKKLGFIIRPDNMYILLWQFAMVCVILFYILEIGMLLAFTQSFWYDELNSFLATHILFILLFSADILLSPLKSYYDEGILITDVSAIYRNYLKLQLWIDLLGLLAIVVPIAVGSLQSNWIKLLMLLKIYTMQKINIEFQRVTQLNITISTIYLVLKLIVFCYIYGHYMGIGFYMVSLWVYNNNYYGPNTPNWCWVYNAWAFYQMSIILTWPQMYIYIMYYSMAVVTTIAYGDITPKNPLQCIYTIFALITVTLIFGYLMTEILRLLINVFAYNFSRKFVHDELILKLKNQRVQQTVQIQFRSHTNQIDRQQQFRNRSIQQKLMYFLPAQPLYGLLAIIYQSFLKDLGFNFINISGKHLKPYDCKSLFLQHFMREIKEERHYIGDILYNYGQTHLQSSLGHCVYYFTKKIYQKTVILGVGQFPTLKAGKLEHINNSRKKSFQIRRSKQLFGQSEFLNGHQRSHWAFCSSNCVIFVASRNSLLNYYNLLTLDEKQVVFTRMQNSQQQDCLFCQGNHNLAKCSYVFLNNNQFTPNHQNVNRTKSNVKQYKTGLKRQSSWSIYKKIREIKIIITKQYKDKLLFNKANHALFMEYELDQGNELDQQQEFDKQLYQTEVMVEKIYEQFLIQRGLKSQNIQYDKIYQYKYYKPYNNIDKIIADVNNKQRKYKSRFMI